MPTQFGPGALAGATEAGISYDQQHSNTELAGPSQALDAALQYSARGWPVFPCQWQGLWRKRPLTVHGFRDATTDCAVITAWWRRWPKALIGVPTGRASGFVVLDIDVRHNERHGFDTLAALGRAILPDTPMAHTASQGLHLYFRPPEHVEIGCTEGEKGRGIGRGLDWRGTGGYVIVPSPGSGYLWDPHWSPETVALGPVPDSLLPREPERLSPAAPPVRPTIGLSPYAEAALDSACRRIIAAPSGQQGATLNAECFAIGTLAGASAIPSDFACRALTWAARQIPDYDHQRPWRTHDIENKVNRAFDQGVRHPREARGA
jgi:putative DNA primase/helicase